MWNIDLPVQKVRGFYQGFYQGLYKDYNFEVDQECFGKTSVKYLYYLKWDLNHFQADYFTEIMGLLYNMYYMFDFNCKFEQIAYDLSEHCFNHNCEPEQLIKNEMGNVFQVTGALNALAAVYYGEQPTDDQHTAWFDMYADVGLNAGKLARYTLMFDPAEGVD